MYEAAVICLIISTVLFVVEAFVEVKSNISVDAIAWAFFVFAIALYIIESTPAFD